MRKYIILTVFAVAWCYIEAQAQQRPSATNIGFLGAQSDVETSENGTATILVNGGTTITSGKTDIGPEGSSVSIGFPYPVRYFNQVFDNDVFISKGYFPDIVQLQWNIISNADGIERFLVYRKPVGSAGDSTLVASISSDTFAFSDEFIQQGVLYKYTIFAQGIADDFRFPFINIVEGTGFAFPVGLVSGRVTFEGGTAVQGVTVVAETDGNLKGKSIYLNGSDAFLTVAATQDDEELILSNGYSVQLWTRFDGTPGSGGALFVKGDDHELSYDGQEFTFRVKNTELVMPYIAPVDSFFHVSAVYDNAGELRLRALTHDDNQTSASMDITDHPDPIVRDLTFGRNDAGNFYHGYIDELRLFQMVLDSAEILSNYSRHLSGLEDNLSAYWRLDAGVSDEFFDFSQPDPGAFNENHGRAINAVFTDETPLASQLSFKGITDENGNYTITGFPFESSGSLYRFTPILGIHEFEPTEQIRFVGPSEAIHNQIDFEDVSSFPVSGSVFYKNTPFPVEGIIINIDGQPAIDEEGEIILTDEDGRFTVDVPIGRHSLQVEQVGHGFEGDGRFPVSGSEEVAKFNFLEPLAGLLFQDTTLRRVAGRVVGGPVEEAKPLGFGLSRDNIGDATIFLSPQKSVDLTFEEADSIINTTDVLNETKFTTSVNFNTSSIEISPDPATGEFVALLPPEKYMITNVIAGSYDFDNSFNSVIDLTQTFEENEFIQETLAAEVDGEELPGFPPFDILDYDSIFNVISADTIFTVGTDSFFYDLRKDFILRLAPTVNVTNFYGEEIFGETSLRYTDNNLGIDQEIDIYDETSQEYAFGQPVFQTGRSYGIKISLFEEYDNGSETDQVPVTDGFVNISNDLSINGDGIQIDLDQNGSVQYIFKAGDPNVNVDVIAPENSFTKTLNITAFSGNEGSIQTTWRENDPFRGIVFGSIATGNNFVTSGPNEVDIILRDPPGGESFAFVEEGRTVTNSYRNSLVDSDGVESETNFSLGGTVATVLGIGSAVLNEIKVERSLEIGVERTTTKTSEDSYSQETQFTRTISTIGGAQSDQIFFTGRDGDVFIGRSTNIVYGLSNVLGLIPSSDCGVDNDCTDIDVEGFKIGKDRALSLSPEFNTAFAFSQFFIESNLIPDLEMIRNSFLTYSTQPDTIANPVEGPIYISKLDPNDPNFGSSNTDANVWGENATIYPDDGLSYTTIFPVGFMGSRNDTVVYYNQQIRDWIEILVENERQKVNAKLIKNVSFDAGAFIEESVTYTETSQRSSSYEINIDSDVALAAGLQVNGNGISEKLSFTTTKTSGSTNSAGETSSVTYGYELGDEDIGDAYTIDVLAPEDGYGPVFSIRGGATSCPYEGETRTKYYEPGRLLNAATAQREIPEIGVEEPILTEIPENRSAFYTLLLNNNSDTEEGFQMELDIVDGTNPSGAVLEVDGAPLGNGLVFQVNPGETLSKTLSLSKGQDDVLDYENIGLTLRSLCQSDPNDNLENIADTVFVSAFFQPGCSDLELKSPADQWTLNTRANIEGIVPIAIDNYDLNFDNFQRIDLQYKPSSSSQWITEMRFFNDQNFTQEEFDAEQEPKQFIDGGSINFNFDFNTLPDRAYDIRAVSKCVFGAGVEVETPSDIVSGIKDTTRPQLFGTPQPGDGILSVGDDISVKFSEDIESGLLTLFNFSLKGVFNDTPIDHNVSVNFDGVDDYVRIQNGLDISNGDYSIFFWLRRQVFGQQYILVSKGDTPDDVLEYGFDAENKFFLNVSGEIIRSIQTYPTTGDSDWEYYAVTFNSDENTFNAFRNGEFIMEAAAFSTSYSGQGPLSLGRSQVSSDQNFTGNMHELRIWDIELSQGEVVSDKDKALTGSEPGLIGYWQMNEAFGNLALDKARFRHANVFADWQVDPRGYSLDFDGVDDYLELNTGSTVVIEDDGDFSIEFWFNAAAGQNNTVIFSNGLADGSDEFNVAEDSWNIGINGDGLLYVLNNGSELILPGSDALIDDNWHHFALSLNRIGTLNVYLDAQLGASTSASGLGGLTGSRMWLGARVNNIGTNTIQQQQFYDGLIDEFRIWAGVRRESQIELDLNSALVGDETGLIAYYPFESFEINVGIPVRTASLEDQDINTFGPNGGVAIASGGLDFSENTATIKVARPVSSIDFNWIVNGDEIIIEPSSSFETLIQGTVIDISVEGVEDKFQNRLNSPISWTAFVDLSQVKWGATSIRKDKALNEELEFQVEIVNSGGTEQNFNIDNIPVWLSVDPQSGNISPLSVETLTFTVNEGLNTGYFEEDIFLSTEQGFREKLQLNIDVLGNTPNWSVNASDYQFSMNVIGILQVEGVTSSDENDMVAAFVGDEIRGVANLEYVSDLDQYQLYIDIYSNQASDETIELRVWDASSGVEFRNAQPIYTFSSNALFGSPTAPEIVRAGEQSVQNINLDPGWNWLAYNIQSDQLADLDGLLGGIAAQNGDQIKAQDAADVFTEGVGWLGSISDNGGFEIGPMYQFFIQNGGSFEVVGTIPGEITIPIVTGWNWLGFTPRFNLDISEAFAAFGPSQGDIVKGQLSFSVYDQSLGWVGSLQSLKTGKGYLFNSDKAGNLSFPLVSSLNAGGREIASNRQFEYVDPYDFANTMSIIAKVESGTGSKIIVGNENGYRGESELIEINGEQYHFINVYGNTDGSELNYFTIINGEIIQFNEHVIFEENAVVGSITEPVELTLDNSSKLDDVLIYPNPFDSSLKLRISRKSNVNGVEITDLSGRVIQSLSLQVSSNDGLREISIGGISLIDPGVYLLRFQLNGSHRTFKIVKQ